MDLLGCLKTLVKWILGGIAIMIFIAASKKFTVFEYGSKTRGCHFPSVQTSISAADVGASTPTWRTGDLIFFNVSRKRSLLSNGWENFIIFNSNCAYPHVGMIIRHQITGELGLLSYGFTPKKFRLPTLSANDGVDEKWEVRPLRNVLRAATSILHMPLKPSVHLGPNDIVRGMERFGHRKYALKAYINYLLIPLIKCTENTLFCSGGLLFLMASMGLIDMEKIKRDFVAQGRSMNDLYICLACDFWRDPIGNEIAQIYDAPIRMKVIS